MAAALCFLSVSPIRNGNTQPTEWQNNLRIHQTATEGNSGRRTTGEDNMTREDKERLGIATGLTIVSGIGLMAVVATGAPLGLCAVLFLAIAGGASGWVSISGGDK